jgi:hypothetical protein
VHFCKIIKIFSYVFVLLRLFILIFPTINTNKFVLVLLLFALISYDKEEIGFSDFPDMGIPSGQKDAYDVSRPNY